MNRRQLDQQLNVYSTITEDSRLVEVLQGRPCRAHSFALQGRGTPGVAWIEKNKWENATAESCNAPKAVASLCLMMGPALSAGFCLMSIFTTRTVLLIFAYV